MRKSIKLSLILLASLFLLAIFAFSNTVVSKGTVTADYTPATFEFENGAYVKLGGNGGMRFRLKMDADTATAVQASGENLTFYAIPLSNAAYLENDDYEQLVEDGRATKNIVNKTTGIYAGKVWDEKQENYVADGYYYANCLFNINLAEYSNTYNDLELYAVAVWDGNTAISPARTLRNTASAGALRAGYYATIKTVYAWLGTADYPIVAADTDDYTALKTILDTDSDLYFYLNDVADVDGIIDGHNGSITQKTVTIDMDGGALSDGVNDNITSLTVDYGTSASELDGLTKTKANYTFTKWQYYNGSAYVDLPANATVTGDISIKAVWTINTYTVTVVSNNAGYGKVNAESSVAIADVVYGTAITVDGNVISIGETDVTATATTSDAQYTYAFTGFTGNTATVAGALTITANFTRTVNQYTVTFDTNGGSSIAATEYDYGTLTSTLPEATKAGSTFLYWTLSNGDPLPETITNDITVKAVWGIGTATTLNIANKADFLAMGTTFAGYHEKERPFISFALTADLVFSTGDFTYNLKDDPDFIGFYETPKTGYLVRNLDCVFDGQGHTITTDYQKGVDWEVTGVTSGFTVMFREIGENGVLRNLKVVATTDSGWGESSVTKDNRGRIENCYITASHTYQYGWASWQCFCNTAEIIYNYGTVRNCVFNLYTYHNSEGATGLTNYAVRYTFAGGSIENCTVIGNSGHNISSNNGNWDTAANSDDKRDNCYVFASVSDLLSGNGYKYNADGTVTAGTYADAKNLYTGTNWTAWLNS